MNCVCGGAIMEFWGFDACGQYNQIPRCLCCGRVWEPMRWLSEAEQGEAEREYAGTFGFRTLTELDDALLRDEV
jgi:hypothetical protein